MRKLIFISFLYVGFTTTAQNTVTVTDNPGYQPEISAVLDIYSTEKGMLVPRMSTEQILMVSNPAIGLLVFNSEMNSFWFYNGSTWDDLSSGTSNLWSLDQNSGSVYLKNGQSNIGIGTSNPVGKLSIVGNAGGNPDNPLFEVKDEFGNPIFSVTSEGVRVYVKDITKGSSGGFAVGRYGIVKGIPDPSYLVVTPDSTRVYTSQTTKGATGGFAVGRYGIAKGVSENYMHLTENNYFIGFKAGDSISTGLYNIFMGNESGISDTSGSGNVFIGHLSGYSNSNGNANVFIGNSAGKSNTTGYYNVMVGNDAGKNSTMGAFNIFVGNSAGENVTTGLSNVLVGRNAGYKITTGSNNLILGAEAGSNLFEANNNILVGYLSGKSIYNGYSNIMIGTECGFTNTNGRNNVFVGERAGFNNNGEFNVFIGNYAGYHETGDGKLYINNTDADQNDALIYGSFDSNYLQFNVNSGGVEGRVNINSVLKLSPRTTAPPYPEKGDIYYDGNLDVIKFYNGTGWIVL